MSVTISGPITGILISVGAADTECTGTTTSQISVVEGFVSSSGDNQSVPLSSLSSSTDPVRFGSPVEANQLMGSGYYMNSISIVGDYNYDDEASGTCALGTTIWTSVFGFCNAEGQTLPVNVSSFVIDRNDCGGNYESETLTTTFSAPLGQMITSFDANYDSVANCIINLTITNVAYAAIPGWTGSTSTTAPTTTPAPTAAGATSAPTVPGATLAPTGSSAPTTPGTTYSSTPPPTTAPSDSTTIIIVVVAVILVVVILFMYMRSRNSQSSNTDIYNTSNEVPWQGLPPQSY
jgi:hypothetical protein